MHHNDVVLTKIIITCCFHYKHDEMMGVHSVAVIPLSIFFSHLSSSRYCILIDKMNWNMVTRMMILQVGLEGDVPCVILVANCQSDFYQVLHYFLPLSYSLIYSVLTWQTIQQVTRAKFINVVINIENLCYVQTAHEQ